MQGLPPLPRLLACREPNPALASVPAPRILRSNPAFEPLVRGQRDSPMRYGLSSSSTSAMCHTESAPSSTPWTRPSKGEHAQFKWRDLAWSHESLREVGASLAAALVASMSNVLLLTVSRVRIVLRQACGQWCIADEPLPRRPARRSQV